MGAQGAIAPMRVLVIDDNAIDRDLFRRLLQQDHRVPCFECVEGEHGRAGLEQLRRLRPACVLLDLNLPDMDGLELLRSMLQEPDPCPVIVTTAYGSEQIAVEAMKAGAADYVVKGSISGEVLLHTIENALQKRALERKVEEQRLAIEEHNRQLESALGRERQARKAVEESESRYRTLAEALPQVVWTAVRPGGGWDYVNQRWARLTGASPEKALGRGWLDFVDAAERQRVSESWDAAAAGIATVELQFRLRSSDGSPRFQLLRALPLLEGGRLKKWLGTLTDMEDQRRNEQLLHQRQKLESIGILAGGVAHDFNNLLVGIIGGLSYALDLLPADHEVCPIIQAAFKSGERAAHLTRQLLAYAGKGKFQVEEVDLGQTLHATWELIQASVPRSTHLKLLIQPGLPPIRTDAAQLQQIIMNLILNASEAIPPERQGLIVVRAELQDIDALRSTVSGDLAPGPYVTLEVRDNGSGIEPDALGKIFDPFFTTKFTGRGLGLAAVHGIVRSNKGSIDVNSVPGQGTTFRVLLPASPAAPAVAPPADRAVEPSPAGSILVVDDEPVVCSTARAVLERAGHRVEVARSGQEALDKLVTSPARFSLVLLDLSMPGLDGEQTFQAIHGMQPELPVVICSGYSDGEVRERFRGREVSGFLQKPFHSRALAGKVAELLRPA